MSFKICGDEIKPNTHSYFGLKVAKLLDGNELSIPLHIIKGKNKGPVLGLFASMHGTEYYHNRTLRTIVNETDPSELNGTILAIPISNPLAFSHKTRNTPSPPETTYDFSNLGGVFPGKRVTPIFGSLEENDVELTMRMAGVITDEVLPKCNYVMDFHGHGHGIALKKMLYNRDDNKSFEIARIFGLGIIHDPITSPEPSTPSPPRGLGGVLRKFGITSITPEIGGPGHGESFEKEVVRLGVQGIRNIMIHLNMIEGEIVLPEKQFYFRNAPHLRSKNGGYLVTDIEPEDIGIGKPTREVSKGEVLGTVYDPYTLKEIEQLRAPVDGLLYMTGITRPVEAYEISGFAVADIKDSKWIE